MLAIKLPKGKTGAAFERAAKQYSAAIAVYNGKHKQALEEWRKGAEHLGQDIWTTELDTPSKPHQISELTCKRERYWRRADACKHSTGDVYLSADEWEEIKGCY